MKKSPYQRRVLGVSLPPIQWSMARPETIRQSLEVTRRELARADEVEREQIESRIASLEHALRLSR